jgi:NAD(P)-dependent dehydrogenase (short-subunit alcohol dehydrogenase family)
MGDLAGSLAGSVAVVTGSNSGLGRAAATSLAGRGATVVMACRSEDRTRPVMEEIVATSGNDRVEFLPLDLGDLSSVRQAAAALSATGRPINLLINNAGVAGQRGMTKSGFELAFGVNHVGHFLFTTLLLDRIVASGPARIVNVSSGNHFLATGIDFDAVRRPTRTFIGLKEYNVSKLANVLFTISLAGRIDPARVSSFSVNPGPVATDVWRRMPGPMYAIYRRMARLQSVETGSLPTLHAATAPGIEAISGTYFDQDCRAKQVSGYATPELADELWRRSEQWVAEDRP